MQYPLAKIVAGYNNADNLVAWESIIPTGDQAFFSPVVFATFDPGQEHTNTDGTPYFGGYAKAEPGWTALTQAQAYYIFHTICGDKYWAYATVQFREFDPDTWHIYNSLIRLKKLPEQKKVNRAFSQFGLFYTRLELLT
jgi:hypothetical protein